MVRNTYMVVSTAVKSADELFGIMAGLTDLMSSHPDHVYSRVVRGVEDEL